LGLCGWAAGHDGEGQIPTVSIENSSRDACCVAEKDRFIENKGLNSNLATPIGVASTRLGQKQKQLPNGGSCGEALILFLISVYHPSMAGTM
jgi:hypothetical protein